METTKKQSYILYALGQWYEQANKQVQNNELEVAISKAIFIDLVMKAKIVEKKERALYKNLEELEKKKLIGYSSRNLSLTKKGSKLYEKLNTEIKPYVKLSNLLGKTNPLSYTKKAQTVFKLKK